MLEKDKVPLTVAERKQAERTRKVQLGLKRVEIWVLPEDIEAVKMLERQSKKKANDLAK